MPLINSEKKFILTLLAKWIIPHLVRAGTFTITNTKLYAPVVTLSTEGNTKLLKKGTHGVNAQLPCMNESNNACTKITSCCINWSKFSQFLIYHFRIQQIEHSTRNVIIQSQKEQATGLWSTKNLFLINQ